MCITLRAVGTPQWSKLQVRPQGNSASAVVLGDYISGSVSNYTTFCIPLSAFNGFDFTSISLIEIPYSNGAAAFEIHISRIEFTGGTNPFLWFGDPKTNNAHDGQSGSTSALIATLVPGQSCTSSKRARQEIGIAVNGDENTYIKAYPNPFKDHLNFEFSVAEDSEVSLEVFSITGARIATIYEGMATGNIIYNESFQPGDLSTGVYFYRLKTNGYVITEKVLMER